MDGTTFCTQEFKFSADDGLMTVAGYGSVFNVIDGGGDLIVPGAFADSLAARKAEGVGPLPMYLEHGRSGGGPAAPIGKWVDASEDGVGLKVTGELVDTVAGIEAHKLLKAGLLGGLSIGYRVKNADSRVRADDPRRTIKAAELVEVSLVQMPMNAKARVLAVKSDCVYQSIRDFEEFLRDVGGFSNNQAKAIAASGFKAFEAKRDAGESIEDLQSITAALRRNITAMNI